MPKFRTIILLFIIAVAGFLLWKNYGYLTTSYRNWPKPSPPSTSPASFSPSPDLSDPALSFLHLPSGFSANYFARDVPGARSLTSNPDGSVIYVGTRNPGVVYAIAGNTRYTVAGGLNSPNGVAYHQGDLYVAEIHRIIKFPKIDATYQSQPEYEVIYDQLPTDPHHGWRYLAIGPDNRLYLGIGAPCNVCEVEDPFATISSLKLDGTDFRVEARGIRNTVGLAWDPRDQSLWFTDNGRDLMGDDLPPDELNRLSTPGEHFGFPACHGQIGECDGTTPPEVELGPHVAALGLLFYQDKLLLAEHGSWNRTDPIGYRLTSIDLAGDKPSNYQPFVDGWLQADGTALGRPVDLLTLPDNSILVSDDLSGAIYRLTYHN